MILGNKVKVSLIFAWYDFWIGVFYDTKKRIIYVCPLPCCVIKIELGDVDDTRN